MIACDITTPELVDNNSELSGFIATEDDEFDIPDIVDATGINSFICCKNDMD